MPRKTKEQNELETKETPKKAAKKTSTVKKTTSKTSTKKEPAKKTTSASKSTTKNTAKKTSEKKPTTTKTTTAKKTSATKKTTTTKKSTTKSTTTRTRKKSISKVEEITPVVEYYDLPYRYNQTVVKVLAQTPNTLFVYWDISDTDRENYQKQYGERFFEETKPVLIVKNNSLGYSFEVDINDFANSWYLHVNDAKCDYSIELGRRPITYNEKINTDYIYISKSNDIESPNNRVLFNKEQKMVYFRNIKTGEQTSKELSNLSFIRNMGNIYHIYDLYKEIYQEENIESLFNTSNPSSGNPSSGTFSSQFK